MEPWTQEVHEPLLWECAPGKGCSVLASLLKVVARLLQALQWELGESLSQKHPDHCDIYQLMD